SWSAGVQTVYLGEGCSAKSYEGWFFEIAGTAGPAWAGVDIGMGQGWCGAPWGYSGTFEGGAGICVDAGSEWTRLGGKVALCFYTLVGTHYTGAKCCGK